jgi:hypothetical protein
MAIEQFIKRILSQRGPGVQARESDTNHDFVQKLKSQERME